MANRLGHFFYSSSIGDVLHHSLPGLLPEINRGDTIGIRESHRDPFRAEDAQLLVPQSMYQRDHADVTPCRRSHVA